MSAADLKQLRRALTPAPLRGKPLRAAQRAALGLLHRKHPVRNLFVAALPKSGSTWLERMLCEAPGFMRWTPPTIKLTTHDLRREDMIPGPVGCTVTKTHTPPTASNLSVLRDAGRPYIVLVRDLRDAAVSWAHYVALPGRETVAHPEARGLPLDERLTYYIERVAPEKVEWLDGWLEAIEDGLGKLVRYEDLLDSTETVMREVFTHYKIDLPEERVRRIVQKHTFERATGRKRGQADAKSFNRKGVSGDWRTHFSAEHERAMERVAGVALARLGYTAAAV